MNLILKYWRFQEERGDKMRPVWVVVHDKGSIQPEGYIQAWSVSRAQASKQRDEIGGVTRLVRMGPA